jgi:hypothetical protein
LTSPHPLPLPYIVGSGRSGTTLLRAILDAHEELTIPDEVYFGGAGDVLRRGGSWERAFERCAGELQKRWGLAPDEARRRLAASPPRREGDLVRVLLALQAERAGTPRIGLKHPDDSLRVLDLASELPEARFIHVLRDGTAVTASFTRAGFGPTSVVECADLWRRRTDGACEGRALGDDRYLEVRFEDLVTDTEAQVRKVCAFLDLAFEPSMLDASGRSDVDLPDRPEHARVYQAIDRTRAEGAALRGRDLLAFDVIAGATQRRLGYPSSPTPLGAGSRIAVRAELRARHAARAVRHTAVRVRVRVGALRRRAMSRRR